MQTLLNTSEDMSWLWETHCKAYASHKASFLSAVLHGNEDSPNKVELYRKQSPLVSDVPLVLVADSESNLVPECTPGSFLSAYVTCALWSSTGEDSEPLDKEHDESDIAPVALFEMASDCADFRESNRALLARYVEELAANEWSYDERQGHDFWLTRNGHGAGFWDRGLPDNLGDALTDAAKAYGSQDIYKGDDGKLYVS